MPMAVADDGRTVVGKWMDRNGELTRVLDRDAGAARWELHAPGSVHMMDDIGPGKFTAISRDGTVSARRIDAYTPAVTRGNSWGATPVALPDTAEREPERSRIASLSANGRVMAGWTSRVVRRDWRIVPTAWIDGERHELPRPGHIFTTAGWAQGVSPGGEHIVGVLRSPQHKPFSVMWTTSLDDGSWAVRVLEDSDRTLPGAFAVSTDGETALGRSTNALWRWTIAGGVEQLFEAPSDYWRVDVHGQCDGLRVVVGQLRGGDLETPTGYIWTESTGLRRFDQFVEDLGLDLLCSHPVPRWVSGDGSLIVGEGQAEDGQIIGWMLRIDPLCLQATMLASGLGGSDFFDMLSLIAAGDPRLDISGSIDPTDGSWALPDGRTGIADLMLLMEWRTQGCL
ncbi:MAG: hypothetical protein JJU33_14610 [Phycisphaerales bacterium]|nr:hypothetical protein [Phycisphaerales bacterium]